MSKTVWYISKYAITPQDGNPTRQYFLSKYLAKKGYRVILFSSKSSGIKDAKISGFSRIVQIDGFTHILLNGPEISLGFSVKRVISWIVFEWMLFLKGITCKRKNKPDIIIVSSLSLLTVVTAYVLKKLYGAKLIFEVRDIWPLTIMELKNLSKYNLFVMLLGSIERLGYKKADYIVGTMPKLDDHIKQTIKQPFNYINIPMGYDPDFYNRLEPLPDEVKKQIPTDKFIVGYAGAIGTANCVDEIVEAAKIISTKEREIYFVILGDGPQKSQLQEKAKGLNNVLFLPKIDKKQVNDFLASCHLLLNPWQDKAIYAYGVSPNKWIDYMYSAKPILVSYSGYQSIINEAGCGEFIPANNVNLLAQKIVEYSKKEKAELEQMGQNGKKYLEENLTYAVLAQKYSSIFESLYV